MNPKRIEDSIEMLAKTGHTEQMKQMLFLYNMCIKLHKENKMLKDGLIPYAGQEHVIGEIYLSKLMKCKKLLNRILSNPAVKAEHKNITTLVLDIDHTMKEYK